MMSTRVMTGNRSIGLAGVFVLSAIAASAQGPSPSTARQPAAEAAPQARPATTALQEARVTLARLTERSMTQDAREALARVSTSFRALYKAYTGEEPDPQKTAPAAAAGAAPAADWKRSYDAVNASLTSMIGGGTAAASAGTGQVGTAGTSGSTAATGMQALTQEVRADLTLLRDQLTRFFRAAGGESANVSAPAEDPRR